MMHMINKPFLVEVEIRDQPELAQKPVAIGGLGMICILGVEKLGCKG